MEAIKERMKKMRVFRKKVFALVISLALICTITVVNGPASALECRQSTANQHTLLALDPRFTHFSRISSALDINSLGRADCVGSFTIYQQYDNDSTITMTLQRFEENEGWIDIKEWSKSYSGSGAKLLSKGYYVETGYRYRLVTVANILDDDGGALEIISCDSLIVKY